MKPDKPEDRLEKEAATKADLNEYVKQKREEGEEEPESDGPTIRSPRKPKKKPKKDDGCTLPVFIFFALAAYGAWKLFLAVFG